MSERVAAPSSTRRAHPEGLERVCNTNEGIHGGFLWRLERENEGGAECRGTGGGGRCLRAIYEGGRVCGRSDDTAAHALPREHAAISFFLSSLILPRRPGPGTRSRPTCVLYQLRSTPRRSPSSTQSGSLGPHTAPVRARTARFLANDDPPRPDDDTHDRQRHPGDQKQARGEAQDSVGAAGTGSEEAATTRVCERGGGSSEARGDVEE